jgi:ferredoxin
MPWIDEQKCNGCETCVEACPVGAIVLTDGVAYIKMEDCIRCGICHEICPTDAVRHDSEKIPEEVEANITESKRLMDACVDVLNDPREGQKCLMRLIKHFKAQKVIAEKTLEKLESMKTG